MSIATLSQFNYGHTITSDNQILSFDEGSGEIFASLNVGSYSLGDFTVEIARAMNEVGTNEYTTTLDRATSFITIDGDAAFDLLVSSGSQNSFAVWSLLGFTGADRLALLTYEGNAISGSIYYPQTPLYKFMDFSQNKQAASATVNQSASGRVQVTKYGTLSFMMCNIKYITDKIPQTYITESITGFDDAISFMDYITTKADIEFVPDKATPTVLTKCLLEKTPADNNGVGYRLLEVSGLAGYFETGNIEFRQVEE